MNCHGDSVKMCEEEGRQTKELNGMKETEGKSGNQEKCFNE